MHVADGGSPQKTASCHFPKSLWMTFPLLSVIVPSTSFTLEFQYLACERQSTCASWLGRIDDAAQTLIMFSCSQQMLLLRKQPVPQRVCWRVDERWGSIMISDMSWLAILHSFRRSFKWHTAKQLTSSSQHRLPYIKDWKHVGVLAGMQVKSTICVDSVQTNDGSCILYITPCRLYRGISSNTSICWKRERVCAWRIQNLSNIGSYLHLINFLVKHTDVASVQMLKYFYKNVFQDHV